MSRDLTWKGVLIAVITIVALFYLAPSITDELPGWWSKKEIKLGLDLQGGTHLLLGVETEKAVENTIERISGDLKDTLRRKRVRYNKLERVNDIEIRIDVANSENMDKLTEVLDAEFSNLEELSVKEDMGKFTLRLGLSAREVDQIEKSAVDQGLETIRNRIDEFGVSEPIIQKQGDKNILVQLPGIKDIARAKKLIGQTALLKFKLVDEESSIEDAVRGKPPRGPGTGKGRDTTYQAWPVHPPDRRGLATNDVQAAPWPEKTFQPGQG